MHATAYSLYPYNKLKRETLIVKYIAFQANKTVELTHNLVYCNAKFEMSITAIQSSIHNTGGGGGGGGEEE